MAPYPPYARTGERTHPSQAATLLSTTTVPSPGLDGPPRKPSAINRHCNQYRRSLHHRKLHYAPCKDQVNSAKPSSFDKPLRRPRARPEEASRPRRAASCSTHGPLSASPAVGLCWLDPPAACRGAMIRRDGDDDEAASRPKASRAVPRAPASRSRGRIGRTGRQGGQHRVRVDLYRSPTATAGVLATFLQGIFNVRSC